MKIRKRRALEYHSSGRPGKIQVVPTKPTLTATDLSLAYTPGVAEACYKIADDVDDVYRYTTRGNLVAVVSNGTAVLGLGNIGPEASKPVMEGKSVLFKRFADIDVFDLEIRATAAADVIHFCEMLEPTVGGINLEDIAAPDSFEIEQTLKERLDIPVFHDDQHGTAIISGAALINALDLVGKNVADVRVVFSGAGGAAIATARHYMRLGVQLENITLVDRAGVIRAGREAPMEGHKAEFAHETDAATLADAMGGADVFVGLSAGGLVSGEMVASMAEHPIVFAMANPDPEILPEEVRAVRDDAIIATGRSDYPNQVNNVLGFPSIFRGALDVRARTINDEMKLAATHALAALAREDVPEAVAAAYGGERLRFGVEYLIPTPFDSRVLLQVAPAVAAAAMATGVARLALDMEEYRGALEARLGPAHQLMRSIMDRARRAPKRIVMPEGREQKIVRATTSIRDEGIGTPILLGSRTRIERIAAEEEVDLTGVEIIDPRMSEKLEEYAQHFFERRKRKGVTWPEALDRMQEPSYFASMMLECGDADALLTGVSMHYPDALRPALQTIGTQEGVHGLAGLYMMVFEHALYFFSDTTVKIDPSAEELAETAMLTADFVRRIGVAPRIAMISFSNFGSARHPASDRVRRAADIVRERRPDLEVDGEMQAATAVMPEALHETYGFSRLSGPANVLIFPNLSAANAAYQLLRRLGGAEAIGPILLGMSKPVNVLQRGSSVADITNLAAISALVAEERSRDLTAEAGV